MPSAGFREYPGGWRDPEPVFAALARDAEHAFWLDDAAGQGWSYLGLGGAPLETLPGTPPLGAALPEPAAASAPPFRPGWVGWLEYEGRPCFMPVREAVAFEHASGRVWLFAAEEEPGESPEGSRRAELAALLDWLPERAEQAQPPLPGPAEPPASTTARAAGAATAPPGLRWRHDDARYLAMIAECQAAITRGDAYQLCLTNTATAPGVFDAWRAYRLLRRRTPSHHGGLLRSGGITLLAASPEQFLSLDAGGRLRTKPIKGTRPRGGTAVDDALLHAELRESVKERAENVMIVDLMRNDLSRVAVTGSVRVPELLAVESYATVHQLVSTIEAQLAPGGTVAGVLGALFPAGSMTGAPKESAMAILAELEAGPRGVYSGVFGWIGADGAADLAMVIRSIVLDGSGASVGAGGGITALSEPAAEVAEFHLKAAPLLAVLADSRLAAADRGAAAADARAGEGGAA